jgi:lysophospholipid acyltransferase (LPLAT)-like uncharacterized protein
VSLHASKMLLGPLGWRLCFGSVRVHAERASEAPSPSPCIYACLHRDLIPAILHVRRERPVLLVSSSPDGDILVRILRRYGFGFSRGSTGKDGGQAFVRLLAALRSGRSVGVAVDGPRGPFGAVREGAVQLSRRSGRPIVPLLVRPGRHWRLHNWDRTVVPCPFSRIAILEGEPLLVEPGVAGSELEAWRQRLAGALLGEAPRTRAFRIAGRASGREAET